MIEIGIAPVIYKTEILIVFEGGLVQLEWMVLILAAIIFNADFAGDGWGAKTWVFKKP